MPRSRAATSSGLSAGTAAEATTRSAPSTLRRRARGRPGCPALGERRQVGDRAAVRAADLLARAPAAATPGCASQRRPRRPGAAVATAPPGSAREWQVRRGHGFRPSARRRSACGCLSSVRGGSAVGGRSLRRAAVGAVSANRETLSISPTPIIVMQSELPPKLTNGSVTPVYGSELVTAPMLMIACQRILAVSPSASSRPNGSGARRAIRRPRQPITISSSDHRQRADQPELLADDRQDRVGVGVRQVVRLLAAHPEADAGQPAGAERDERLHRLPALPQRVGERVRGSRASARRGTAPRYDHDRRRERRRPG